MGPANPLTYSPQFVRRNRQAFPLELVALGDVERDHGVRKGTLLEHDGDLPAVGRGPVIEVDRPPAARGPRRFRCRRGLGVAPASCTRSIGDASHADTPFNDAMGLIACRQNRTSGDGTEGTPVDAPDSRHTRKSLSSLRRTTFGFAAMLRTWPTRLIRAEVAQGGSNPARASRALISRDEKARRMSFQAHKNADRINRYAALECCCKTLSPSAPRSRESQSAARPSGYVRKTPRPDPRHQGCKPRRGVDSPATQ
jgi:hypothetical protein